MDLKFTFGGASPDHHDHGDAPSGIPLPFSTAPASTSSVLELSARLGRGSVIGEVITGDGVTYARAEVETQDLAPTGLARATRSALSRAVAELEGPLAESVTAVVLDLGGAESAVASELGLSAAEPTVGEALQRRIGVGAGVPVRIGAN